MDLPRLAKQAASAACDDRRWAAGLAFRAYGRRIGVRMSCPDIVARVAARLPLGWAPAVSPVVERLYSLATDGEACDDGRASRLWVDGGELARTTSADAALDLLEADLQLYVAEMARRRIFIHAGVVGWRQRAILLPGRSFAGKSTLVAELVRAGATYYSDEYAVLDRCGRVHPYARPLSIRDVDGRPRRTTAAALGGRVGERPLPVGLVVVTCYQPGVGWQPRPLTPGDGVLALLAHTLPARRTPAEVLPVLARVMRRAVVLASDRAEARPVAAAILSQYDRLPART